MKLQLLDETMVFSHIPPKAVDLHKVTSGRMLAICGSRDFSGAAALCCLGALKSGCGYVTLASTAYVCQTVAQHHMTPTYIFLPETDRGRIAFSSVQSVLSQMDSYHAVVLGCGLGLDSDTSALVSSILDNSKSTLVLDADGINAVEKNINVLTRFQGHMIITPHEGEMSRLYGKSSEWIHQRRSQVAAEVACTYGITVVLKGPHTLIASPDGTVLENYTGNSGLAKAGSGDLLSGMIGSLAAQGIEPFWAAAAGVYLHGTAADLAAARLSKFSMQPQDIMDDLPEIFLRNAR